MRMNQHEVACAGLMLPDMTEAFNKHNVRDNRDTYLGSCAPAGAPASGTDTYYYLPAAGYNEE